MNKKVTREFNMDIQRVLLIFMVIVLHYNNRGMGGALNYAATGGAGEILLRLSESLCICAVDCFLILSGYFSAYKEGTKPYGKAVFLLCACSFYRTVSYLIYSLLVVHDFSVKTLCGYIIPSNWFVCLFVTVLILSPFINRLLRSLDDHQLNELMLVSTILFVLVPSLTSMVTDVFEVNLLGVSTITVNGDIEGFTIISFLYSYLLGFFIRVRREWISKRPAYIYLLIYAVCACISAGISLKTETVWSYSGIFTVICAASLSAFFSQIRFTNEKAGKILSAIGGCGLGVFVWHTSPLMLYGLWVHFEIYRIAEESIGFYLFNMLTATGTMLVLSLVWVLLVRAVVSRIKKA